MAGQEARLPCPRPGNDAAPGRSMRDGVVAQRATPDIHARQFDLGQRSLLDLLDAENRLILDRSNPTAASRTEDFAVYRVPAVVGNLLPTLGIDRPKETIDAQLIMEQPIGEGTTPRPPRSSDPWRHHPAGAGWGGATPSPSPGPRARTVCQFLVNPVAIVSASCGNGRSRSVRGACSDMNRLRRGAGSRARRGHSNRGKVASVVPVLGAIPHATREKLLTLYEKKRFANRLRLLLFPSGWI